MEYLANFILSGLTIGACYALLALGINVIYSTSGVVNLAQGEVMMLATFVSYVFLTHFHFPILLALLVSILVGGVISWVIQIIVVQPIGVANIHQNITWVLSLIGIMLLIRGVTSIFWGSNIYNFPSLFSDNYISISPSLQISIHQISIIIAAIFLITIFYLIHKFTLFGKKMVAVASNIDAAALMGINVQWIVLYSFLMAGVLAGVAGFLIAPIALLSSDLSLSIGFKAFAAAMIGGVSSPLGAITGGLLLGIVEALSSAFLPAGYSDMIAFILLVLVVAFFPEGFFGKKMEVRV